MTIEYSGTYLDKMSPACGCFEADAKEWRGVTFLSRRLALGPVDASAPGLSSYMLSATYPSPLKPYSEGFLLKADYVAVQPPSNGAFDPRSLVNGNPDGLNIVERKTVAVAPTLTIFTAGPLYEESMGDAPIGAWTPAAGAKLSISRQVERRGQYQFNEVFDHLPDEKDKAAVQRFQTDGDVFPLIDYIGPVLVVWTERPAYLFGGRGFKVELTADGLIHALIIRVPFALRTALGGITGANISHTSFVQYRGDGMMIDPPRRGTFHGTLLDVPDRALDYGTIKSMIDSRPVVNGCGPSGFGSDLCMDFRRPPMPARDGVNIFGPIDRITFASAKGSLMVGARHLDMEPAVPITVLRATSYENPAGDLTIPIQVSTDKIKVDGQFAARGAVTVNGEPVTRRMEALAPFFATLSIILSVCSVLAYLRRPKSD